jgi:GNAT superfamily N-acetyltransferase
MSLGSTRSLTLRRTSLTDPVARALIDALDAELLERYPEEGATHFRLDPDEVAPGRGAFFVAYVFGADLPGGSLPVGCGAVRRLPDGRTAELKRMYTTPEARRRGVAHELLGALEDEARRLAVHRLVLETGVRQPEAIALYKRAGFVEIPPFGEYVGSPLSVCMAKSLAGRAGDGSGRTLAA